MFYASLFPMKPQWMDHEQVLRWMESFSSFNLFVEFTFRLSERPFRRNANNPEPGAPCQG
jgi:hypothetical protein